MTDKNLRIDFGPDGAGARLLPNLFVVSWLGMTTEPITVSDRLSEATFGPIDCHVYLLRSSEGLLLVDCGTPWGHDRIRRNCIHWGLEIKNVRTILLTHAHLDHARGGYLFKRMGVEILAHAEAARHAESEWDDCLKQQHSSEQYCVDGCLEEGARLERCGFDIQVFHTPGHTRGCLSYLIEVDGERCLFSGDLAMSNALPGWQGDPGFCRDNILKSLQQLLKTEFTHLCHGHDAILNDRGRLFREALQKAECGEW